MRPDLNKLMCERERRGSGYLRYRERRHAKKFRARDEDRSEPTHESMTYRYGYDRREFSENLNPLYGAVRKAVNRPYAKFYSELSQVFDKRSVINQHILGHLDDFLTRDLYERDGVLMARRPYVGPDEPLSKVTSIEFYVDPRDGIIKRNKAMKTSRQRARERAREEQNHLDARYRKLPDGSELHLLDGRWFRFELRPAPIGRFVYEQPKGCDEFKLPYQPPRRWDHLRDYEKRRIGVKRFVGENALDVLTGQYVFREPGAEPILYHATKETASRKQLKGAGLYQVEHGGLLRSRIRKGT